MFEGVAKLFKKPDPKELVRKWQATLRAEERKIERQIRDIQFEEKKVRKSITEAAKRSDITTCKILAKEIVQSRRAVSRLYVNKAQMISIGNALSEQLAMVRVAGTLQRSGEVMKLVNESLRMPELQRTIMEMSREMTKAGLIEEMTSEALDGALGTDELEEEADAAVEAVLAEVAGDVLASLPAAKARPAAAAQQAPAEEEPEELAALQERLNAMAKGKKGAEKKVAEKPEAEAKPAPSPAKKPEEDKAGKKGGKKK